MPSFLSLFLFISSISLWLTWYILFELQALRISSEIIDDIRLEHPPNRKMVSLISMSHYSFILLLLVGSSELLSYLILYQLLSVQICCECISQGWQPDTRYIGLYRISVYIGLYRVTRYIFFFSKSDVLDQMYGFSKYQIFLPNIGISYIFDHMLAFHYIAHRVWPDIRY